MFKRIDNFIRRRRTFYAATPAEKELGRYYKMRNAGALQQLSAPLVAIECMRLDPFYFCIFAEIISALRAKLSIRVEQCDLIGLRPHAISSVEAYIVSWLVWNPISAQKWTRLYSGFCDGLAYRAFGLLSPSKEVRIWRDAMAIWRGLKTKDMLAALRINDVLIGDLIIDSYLRFRPSPVVNLNDPYLFVVIRQALKDFDRAFNYFAKHRPRIYLTPYISYVMHGVAARVAASLGIAVFSFLGNRQKFAKRVMHEDPFPSEQPSHYREDFFSLPDQPLKLAIADAALFARISGMRDMTNADMKTSQYEIKVHDVPHVQGAAIIFLHDFYDAPHDGRWMLFQDFWEWACATIEMLQAAGQPFYLKPHPTQRANSDAEVARIKNLYPDCKFISPDITNTQLIEGGMMCAVTVHGSVAAEMAYLGIPTICSADNPHISFGFCRTARSKAEYRHLLESFQKFVCDKHDMKKEACAFYYMYNFNLSDDARKVRDHALRLRSSLHNDLTAGRDLSSANIINDFQALIEENGFKAFVDELIQIMRVPVFEDQRSVISGEGEMKLHGAQNRAMKSHA